MEEFQLEPGEKVIRSVRKHWLVFVLQLSPFAVLAFLPLALPAVLGRLADVAPALALAADVNQPLWRFAVGVWWLFLWTGAFNGFVRYYLNQWIITTTRIVDIHQTGFFSRRVSSFLLDRVQDVTTDVNGLLATLVGFGNLNVETAGREEKFQMAGVGDPTGLRDLIMKEIAILHAARGDTSGV